MDKNWNCITKVMAVFLRDVAVGTLQQLYQGSKCNFTTSMEMLNEEHAVAAPSSSFDAAEKRNKKKKKKKERERELEDA